MEEHRTRELLVGGAKLKAIKTNVITCYSCGRWLGRLPLFYGTGDKGDYCEACFSTGIRVREGRPFGPRSKDWEWLSKEAMELVETFKDDPYPLADLLEGLVFDRAMRGS